MPKTTWSAEYQSANCCEDPGECGSPSQGGWCRSRRPAAVPSGPGWPPSRGRSKPPRRSGPPEWTEARWKRGRRGVGPCLSWRVNAWVALPLRRCDGRPQSSASPRGVHAICDLVARTNLGIPLCISVSSALRFRAMRARSRLWLALAQRGHRSTFLMNARRRDGACRSLGGPRGGARRSGPSTAEGRLHRALRHPAHGGGGGGAHARSGVRRRVGVARGGRRGPRRRPDGAGDRPSRHPSRLPFVSLASALPIDPDAALPPPYLDWPFDDSADG